MAYNQYDLATNSLVKTGSLTEMYIPLWYYSYGFVSTTASNGGNFIQKGTTSVTTNITSQGKLHTSSSNWSTNQKFAFEASIYSGSSPTTVYAQLYDTTTQSNVTGAQLSSTASSFTVLRSGQFTLTPGHTYGVVIWVTSGTTVYLTKASLIAFLS